MTVTRRRQREPVSERTDLADELWTLAHLARYLHCGRSTAFATVADRGFPAALAIRSTRGRHRRLWVAAEVRAWAEELPRIREERRSAAPQPPGTDA